MSLLCRVCGPDSLYEEDLAFCPTHVELLVSYEPEMYSDDTASSYEPPPPPAAAPGCWNCERPPDPAHTICSNPDCNRSLIPPALVIRFRFGQVEVEPGHTVQLGRLGDYGRLFRSYRNVSRHHAVVGVSDEGEAWIEPNPTPNGTFLDGRELPDSRQRPLRTGQTIRFALSAEGEVTVYAHRGGLR